jgi:hypothetical protein
MKEMLMPPGQWVDVKAFVIDWSFPDWNRRDKNKLERNQRCSVSVDLVVPEVQNVVVAQASLPVISGIFCPLTGRDACATNPN